MADNDQWLHDADRLDIPGPRKVKRPRVQLDSEKFGQFAEATAGLWARQSSSST